MKHLSPNDMVRAVWRRRVWFVVPVLLCLAAAVVAYKMLPRKYRAFTTVLVEPQRVPADYVKPTVTTTIEERLRTIEPQIKNRDNLERIIREVGLYPELRYGGSLGEAVNQMRRDMTIQLQGSTFFIFFRGHEPLKVARAANRVAELFIESNLQLRENQAQGTSAFLESEMERTKNRLELQEARIAEFKRLNLGDLPEQRDTNLRSVEQLQTKLEINVDALDKAETRKLLLQTQIAEMRRYPRTTRIVGGAVVPSAPEGPTRLEQLQAQLAELRARYTDRHPDVIRAQAEVEQLEKMERERPRRREEPAAPAAMASAADARDGDDEDEAPRVDPTLKAELASVDIEIRSLKAERERILGDIAAVQGRLENVPRVEQELLSLTRDYDNIRKSYESLLDKRLNARLYENLEKSQQGERFTILERALPPGSPYSPNRFLTLAAGLGLGMLLGFLTVLLRERTDPTYSDAESLQEAFPGVPLLATIPVFQNAQQTTSRDRHGDRRR
jgi:polysaccharide chain length determinant protein (PEP-CTERM system associated)